MSVRKPLTIVAVVSVLAGPPAWLEAQLATPPGGPSPARTSPALEKFSARAIVSTATVRPGDSLHVAVEMSIAEGFWVYGPVAGGKLVAAQDLTIRPGSSPLQPGAVLFQPARPHVTRFPDGTSDSHNIYQHKAYAFVPVKVPADLAPGSYELPLHIAGQLCDPQTCLQLNTTIAAKVKVGTATIASPEWTDELRAALARARTAEQWAGVHTQPADQAGRIRFRVLGGSWLEGVGLAGGLAVAVLAGMLLNLMPCVLPVIPLRLLALLNQARESRRRFVTLGLAFAAGIVLFFLAMAVVGAAVKLSVGREVTLNDVFRHPPLLIGLVLLLVVLAMNMFGLFALTVPGSVAAAEMRPGHLGAAGMGFLFAVLSTPCSAPVIAAQFIWAQVQPTWVGAGAMVLMGLGMAFPHALLCFFPAAVAKLPRAGRWTGLLKEFVGFVLLLIAAWLIGTQLSDRYLGWVVGYAVVLAMCLWIWGRWVDATTPIWRRRAVRAGALALAVVAGVWMLRPPPAPAIKMQPFDAAAIAAARRAGKTVLVKFTAAWCVECLVVEKAIYEDPEVARRLRDEGIVAVKGDVTKADYPASKMLYEQLRQPGPPLTAVLPPGTGPAILLRGVFSKADLFEALDSAAAAGAGKGR